MHRTRGTLATELADAGEAEEAFATGEESLLWLTEHDVAARRPEWEIRFAAIERAAGRYADSHARLRRVFDQPSGDREIDEVAASRLAHDTLSYGRFDEAIEAADRAVGSRNAARRHWAYRIRAIARFELGDYAAAAEDRLAAIAAGEVASDHRFDPEVHLELARDYLAADQPSEAVEVAELVLRSLTTDPEGGVADPATLDETRRLLALGYTELDEPALALEHVHARQGALGPDADAVTRAILFEQEAIALQPLDRHVEAVAVLVRAAELFAEAGEPVARVVALRRAVMSAADDSDPTVAGGLLDDAVAALDQIPPEHEDRWFHTGWLWLQRAEHDLRARDRERATADFTQAEAAFHAGGLGDAATEALLRRAEHVGADLDEVRGVFLAETEGTPAWYRSGWVLVDLLAEQDQTTESEALGEQLEATYRAAQGGA